MSMMTNSAMSCRIIGFGFAGVSLPDSGIFHSGILHCYGTCFFENNYAVTV